MLQNPPSYTYPNKRSNYSFKAKKKYIHQFLERQPLNIENTTAMFLKECDFYEVRTFKLNHKTLQSHNKIPQVEDVKTMLQ